MTTRYYKIPLPTALQTASTQRTVLDGVSYRIDWRYNGRISRWAFSLYDQDDLPIAQNRLLVVNIPLLLSVSVTNRPPGEFVCLTRDDTDPGLDIAEARLYYVSAE